MRGAVTCGVLSVVCGLAVMSLMLENAVRCLRMKAVVLESDVRVVREVEAAIAAVRPKVASCARLSSRLQEL